MKTHILFIGALLVALILVGCTSQTTAPAPTNLPTKTDTPTPLPTATQTPVPEPTRTSSPTPTITPTPTLTPPPTLAPEKADEIVRELMLVPTAPCFLGICPEQTTLGEAMNTFTYLGFAVEHTLTQKSIAYYDAVKNLENGLEISPLLAIQDNIVKSFVINIHPEDEQVGVLRAWLAYSPDTLIDHYGTPTKIGVFVGGGPRDQYDIVLYFDSVDLIIQYISTKDNYVKDTNSFRFCPLVDQYEIVTVWSGKDPEYPPLLGFAFEDVTALSLDEFSALMKGNPVEACIDIPRDVLFP